MKDAGRVVTVQGPVDPERIGMTLTHEHLLMDIMTWFRQFPQDGSARPTYNPVTGDNAALLREHPYYSRENLVNADWREAATEIRRFKLAGGNTVVDTSNHGCGRDTWALRKIADDVGINVVAGCGYYVDPTHPWDMDERSVDDVTAEIVADLVEGTEGTDIRCGIIGEIGMSDPITENEWKVLRAAVQAHHETGAAISIHSNHAMRLAPEIVRFVLDHGVHPSRVIQCHLDLFPEDVAYATEVAETGVFVELDGWGHSHPTQGVTVTDDARAAATEALVEKGFESQLLFSLDLGLPARMARFGGPGYSHIVYDVVPRLLRRGIAKRTLQRILVENPRRVLPLASVAAGA